MVRFVDLDEDGFEQRDSHQYSRDELPSAWDHDRPNPNYSLSFAVALSCYPIISQLASYVDINTLHELSRTCRQFRANLLQYRKLLMEQTLRCENETSNPAQRLGNALNASLEQWTAYGRNGVKIGRISSGKVGPCAIDSVGACRRCSRVVCRNCVIKAPTLNVLKNRHRRLCKKCMKCPLERLTTITRRDSTMHDDDSVSDYARDPCTCDEAVWICQPCGQIRRTEDTTYLRGWVWRTKYSACGGIGAGLGEGNEGVECGRHSSCLAARKVEKEIECDADELAALEAEMEAAADEAGCRDWKGSSYNTHEIVGIGGQVKKKLNKTVLVGAIVKEYEEERVTGKFLQREKEGVNRAWCSWCERAVTGKKDAERVGMSTDSVVSSTSSNESSASS